MFSVTTARAKVPSQLSAFGCDSQTGVCARCLGNRIDSEGLGLPFPQGISNLINFVFHVFFDDTATKFIGWENSPFQAEVEFASLGVGITGIIAFKVSLPFRFATLIPPSAFFIGRGWRSHLPDDRRAQFFAGQRGIGFSNRSIYADYRVRVSVAVV